MMKAETIPESKEKSLSFWQVFHKTMPLVFAACPVYFIVNNVLSIIHGMSWGVETWARQGLFDAVTRAVEASGTVGLVILTAILLCLAAIGCQVLNGVVNFMAGAMLNRIKGHLDQQIHKKAGRLDPLVYENPAHLDTLNKAKEGASYTGMMISLLMTIFTFYLPYFIFMGAYLYALKPILLLCIVIVFLPNLLTNLVRTQVFAKFEDQAAPIRRQMDYYEEAQCDRAYFKETRVLGSIGFFRKLYEETIQRLNKATWAAERRTGRIELALKAITLAGYGLILWLLLIALRQGEITVGAFAAVFSSIGSLFSIMEEIVCRHLGHIAQNMASVRNFVDFLDLPERQGSPQTPDPSMGITAENICFRYPDASQDSLRDITLTIRPGETLAIVGENGAGKSTLVRLLTGLYLPTSGQVHIGGCDTSTASPASIWRGISGVFQKYQRYQLTLRENIRISDIEAANPEAAALENAGLTNDQDSFPQGMDTMLSREFDGTDLSGGQWQRVAIARGLYRAHGMIILDEPTAAIDPIEETHVYQRFATLAQDATALIVTHRLGSARIADRILVMEDGRIVEEGSHEGLIQGGGVYARMWEAQAQWYA